MWPGGGTLDNTTKMSGNTCTYILFFVSESKHLKKQGQNMEKNDCYD